MNKENSFFQLEASKTDPNALSEQTISFTLAKELSQAYLKNWEYRIPLPPNPNTPQEYWKGFRIHTESILDILGIDPDLVRTNIKAIFVHFGVHPADLLKKNPVEQRITLVFSPIVNDPDDPTNPNGKIDENGKIYEYVDPCPDKCPTNLK